MSTLVDANTNRLSGFGYSYDGNGNLLTMPQQSASMTYDGSNRMVKFTNQNDTESYQYAPDNKRVWRSKGCSYQSVVDGSIQTSPALTFYSVFGQKLGEYCPSPEPNIPLGPLVMSEEVYFGGRKVAKWDGYGNLAPLTTDRLHSKGDGSTFFPYGETKSGTAITGDSVATYSRDWSGLDYADQRWYAPGVGRFTGVDRIYPSQVQQSPAKFNRFSYVYNRPLDYLDIDGLVPVSVIVATEMSYRAIFSYKTPPIEVTDTMDPIPYIHAGGWGGTANTPSLEAPPSDYTSGVADWCSVLPDAQVQSYSVQMSTVANLNITASVVTNFLTGDVTLYVYMALAGANIGGAVGANYQYGFAQNYNATGGGHPASAFGPGGAISYDVASLVPLLNLSAGGGFNSGANGTSAAHAFLQFGVGIGYAQLSFTTPIAGGSFKPLFQATLFNVKELMNSSAGAALAFFEDPLLAAAYRAFQANCQ
ncbi:MAG: RHS repeat-associated core domain-containing protein [Bryobacter sp.]|nr:RHS repeat-associated core domain-containing protein [Bryobacter sp.]